MRVRESDSVREHESAKECGVRKRENERMRVEKDRMRDWESDSVSE